MREQNAAGGQKGELQDAARIHLALGSFVHQISMQLLPAWVCLFDQLQFPRALPFLDCLLAKNCGFHCPMLFVPNQIVDPILLCKPVNQIVFVFPDALDQI